jgi:mannosyltransferase OCH1-like enzyme
LFHKLCYEKIKRTAEKEGWELHLLTKKNVKNYLPNYEELQVKINESMLTKPQTVADLIRISIIYYHGGVYFDMSSILINGLKWL